MRDPASLLEQPKNQGQEQTDEQARYQGEIKCEVSAGVMDVPRQSPEPALAPPSPEHQTHRHHEQPDDHEKLSEVIHPGLRISRDDGFAKSPASMGCDGE